LAARRLEDRPKVEPGSRAEWRAWLQAHHADSGSVWLVTLKKAAGEPPLTQAEAIEEALCFGWIDSLPRKLDDARTMLLMAPRKPGSAWSKINRERVERLTATGRMSPAGLAKLESAKADGSWSRLDAADALLVPDDLAAALAARPGARGCWDGFPASTRRGVLEWIGAAKTPLTREKRVQETAALASENRRANQWRGR
jgi:uncharacterized protein YdeI (YjbR/CyaY-like superfamily)